MEHQEGVSAMGSATHPLMTLNSTILIPLHPSTHLDPAQLRYMIGFGPKVNCTLDLCPLEMSVTAYRPSVPVNIIFIALYSFAMTIHIMLGFRWQSWFFTLCCVTCTISAIAGYVARIFMHYNPFAFYPFLIQGGKCVHDPAWLSLSLTRKDRVTDCLS